jgi:hypothetical protein
MLNMRVVPVRPEREEEVQVMVSEAEGTDNTTFELIALTAVPFATLNVSPPSSEALVAA